MDAGPYVTNQKQTTVWYVSHVWNGKVTEFLKCVSEHYRARDIGIFLMPGLGRQKSFKCAVFVFLCQYSKCSTRKRNLAAGTE